jgi:hypothetical protein
MKMNTKTVRYSIDNGKTFDEWQMDVTLNYEECVTVIAEHYSVDESEVVLANWLH